MSSPRTITTNLPFGLFSAATLSGPMQTPSEISPAILNPDNAGPLAPASEFDAEEGNEKPFWED